MAEKVGPDHAELVLRDVPGKPRKRRRKLERLDRRPFLFTYTPELEPARGEVVRVTSPPRSLRPRSPCALTRRRRARPLSIAHSAVRIKPPPADPTWALLEHPMMLGRSAGNVDGPLLTSRGGSFLASA
jgi:hypothetical protein